MDGACSILANWSWRSLKTNGFREVHVALCAEVSSLKPHGEAPLMGVHPALFSFLEFLNPFETRPFQLSCPFCFQHLTVSPNDKKLLQPRMNVWSLYSTSFGVVLVDCTLYQLCESPAGFGRIWQQKFTQLGCLANIVTNLHTGSYTW